MVALQKSLPVNNNLNVKPSASLMHMVVVGSDHYLGQTDPFILSSNIHHRQWILVHQSATEIRYGSKSSWIKFRQCPSRTCHHRMHGHLAMCFHTFCFSVLRHFLSFLTNQSSVPIMRDIWKLGRSTLWLSVPNAKMQEDRRVSLVSSVHSGDLVPVIHKGSGIVSTGGSAVTPSTSTLYYSISRLPLELQQTILLYAGQYPFFSPSAVLFTARTLVQLAPIFKTLQNHQMRPVNLDILNSVFIGWTTLGNTKYVSYLSNRRLSPDDDCMHRESETFLLKLYLDDVVIRNIEFLGKPECSVVSQQGLSSKSDLWYKTLESHDKTTIYQVQGVSDVCFGCLLQASRR